MSEADVHWVLHHAPDTARLPLTLRRGEQTIQSYIQLKGAWRKNATYWRASVSPLRPGVHLSPDRFKQSKGIGPNEMALTVQYPRGAAAQAGLRSGDLLVAVDGRTDLLLEADFLRYIYFDRPEAASVEVTVVRKGQKLNLTLPLR